VSIVNVALYTKGCEVSNVELFSAGAVTTIGNGYPSFLNSSFEQDAITKILIRKNMDFIFGIIFNFGLVNKKIQI
jgi:hypothetical protein